MAPIQKTLRITGLPLETHQDDVRTFFESHVRSQGRQSVEAIGPICLELGAKTNQTTVTFSSPIAAQQALNLDHPTRQLTAVRGGREIISLDHEFRGITTLQSFANPDTGKPDIDIVALHGLTGHAWNTFTALEISNTDTDRIRENNWLQNNLPELLRAHEEQSIYARIMTFGYDADVWMSKSAADLDEPVRILLWDLRHERQNADDRPLFFIGHSLGGIVVKEAIIKMANEALTESQEKYVFPVHGCLFFGVPHKGAELAETASAVLTWLSKVFNVNKHNVHDLKPKSERLARSSFEFGELRSNFSLPVMSFYETRNMSHTLGMIVSRDSAIFDYPDKPEPFGVDKDHKEMVKILTDRDPTLKAATLFLTDLAKRAIALQDARSRTIQLPPLKQTDAHGRLIEDRFSILRKYDTVFLIDDSPSMAGPKWELVKKILDYCTPMATRYDRNGIDIHFFNDTERSQDNVKQAEIAAQIHHDVTLSGSTPLLDRLSVHLKQYFQKYQKSEWDADFKRYNLIVLTDGEPDSEDDDDSEADNQWKPAFRLIQKKIVQYAKKLDQDNVEAEPGQVGIQFCQIGDDAEASAFFQFLDDRLKGKAKLSRDMVDTIKCVSELDLSHEFFRKLLLGAIDKREDKKNVQRQRPPIDSHSVTLPSRSISKRTTASSLSESDHPVQVTRGYSFPVSSVSGSLLESHKIESSERKTRQPRMAAPDEDHETAPSKRLSSFKKNFGRILDK